jgi:antirestriction protein|tara:strand:- start:1488 stop:1817 length:330 start_codon:yes stop_codon:yes gene_type:complete
MATATFTDKQILKAMEDQGIDEDMLEACRAYIELGLENFIEPELELENFEEAYQGQWPNDEEFAQQMAEDCGLINESATWPNNCIDWEYASRELMYDYSEERGYYFRNL